MRNLNTIIDDMINFIPSSELDLLQQLNNVKDSLIVAAPETMSMWWNIVAEYLGDAIDEITEGWHKDIVTVFNGE